MNKQRRNRRVERTRRHIEYLESKLQAAKAHPEAYRRPQDQKRAQTLYIHKISWWRRVLSTLEQPADS